MKPKKNSQEATWFLTVSLGEHLGIKQTKEYISSSNGENILWTTLHEKLLFFPPKVTKIYRISHLTAWIHRQPQLKWKCLAEPTAWEICTSGGKFVPWGLRWNVDSPQHIKHYYQSQGGLRSLCFRHLAGNGGTFPDTRSHSQGQREPSLTIKKRYQSINRWLHKKIIENRIFKYFFTGMNVYIIKLVYVTERKLSRLVHYLHYFLFNFYSPPLLSRPDLSCSSLAQPSLALSKLIAATRNYLITQKLSTSWSLESITLDNTSLPDFNLHVSTVFI